MLVWQVYGRTDVIALGLLDTISLQTCAQLGGMCVHGHSVLCGFIESQRLRTSTPNNVVFPQVVGKLIHHRMSEKERSRKCAGLGET